MIRILEKSHKINVHCQPKEGKENPMKNLMTLGKTLVIVGALMFVTPLLIGIKLNEQDLREVCAIINFSGAATVCFSFVLMHAAESKKIGWCGKAVSSTIIHSVLSIFFISWAIDPNLALNILGYTKF